VNSIHLSRLRVPFDRAAFTGEPELTSLRRYAGHRLVYPSAHRQRRIVRLFVDWVLAQAAG
jgi:hypothetical protein